MSIRVTRGVHNPSDEGRSLTAGLPVLALAALAVSGCGGGGGSDPGPAPPIPSYNVRGTISGLNAGGLVLALGVNNVTVSLPSGTTTFGFPTSLNANQSYDVTVQTQPTGETCTVSGGTGTTGSGASSPGNPIINVGVTCTANPYSVGGSISGLNGGGLVLANGNDTVSPASGATSFTFSTMLTNGSAYAVTLKTQPSGLFCTITNGSGNIAAADVTNVSVACKAAVASSYENKNDRGYAPVTLPGPSGNAFAVADFFHDGSTALVLHTLVYNPSDASTYNNYGHIYFYKRDSSGNWVDNTATLLTNTTGCLHPRKAIVADFNNDGLPDVFFACHGADAPPYPGEQPHLLLSQSDGTYKNVTLPITCYCHGASAADVTADGYPDILVTDTSVTQTPFFLINNRDGTFTADYSRLPASLKGKQIYSAELVDFSGSGLYDVFLGGNEPGTTGYPATEQGPLILPNDGTGGFSSTTPIDLMIGTGYGLALDIVFSQGNIYLLKVNHGYTGNEIQKIAYPARTQSVIFSHSGAYSNGSNWVDWIIPVSGAIDSENAAYGVSVPQ